MPNPKPLIHGWRRLRLSAAAPERVPGWDVLVLTASCPGQATLYRAQLSAMQRRGRLPCSTHCLVVEDPAGQRIGSGGATLNALAALVQQLGSVEAVAAARILLIHAGGNSTRLPWASVVGKAFIPLPLAADPDEPCPSLCDHLVALTSGLPAHLHGGGLLTCSGDVLPLGHLDALHWPDSGLGVVTIAAPAALAGRHGVIAADAGNRVHTLLQKPNLNQLRSADALLPGDRAQLDTGVWLLRADAVSALAALASDGVSIPALLADGRELGLYDDIPAAALPSDRQAPVRHEPPASPLAGELRTALSGCAVHNIPAPNLHFLHLGTGTELLAHLAAPWAGELQTRQLAACGPAVASDAVVVDSVLSEGARVGSGSLVAMSRLGPRVRLGRRCVVQGVDAMDEALTLPDHHALWQVAMPAGAHPQATQPLWVSVWCGVDDNPKLCDGAATLGNAGLMAWCQARGISDADIWRADEPRCLWTARLYPGSPGRPSLGLVDWMQACPSQFTAGARDLWRAAPRFSLAELAGGFDAPAMLAAAGGRQDQVILAALAQVAAQALDRHAGSLAADLSHGQRPSLLSLATQLPSDAPVPSERWHWLQADLLDAAGAQQPAQVARTRAWAAIHRRVSDALPEMPAWELPDPHAHVGPVGESHCGARIDLAGGWTDTPPMCLDAPAAVCSLGVHLSPDDRSTPRAPIWATASVTAQPGLTLEFPGHPALAPTHLTAMPSAEEIHLDDPFALPKAVCLACGIRIGPGLPGLHLSATSTLPQGSGLGGSSILAAACVQALARCCKVSDDPAQISRRVLLVEQILSTGGGWQDQLGGLMPGAKLLSSLPRSPLDIAIEPIPLAAETLTALGQRLLIIDTGITRLAKNVLQRVVGGYLSRRYFSLRSLSQLAAIAGQARDCLAQGDIDGLGESITEAWRLNQALDPHCSNPEVDQRFAGLPGHWKLTGAGGGGFAVWLAPSDWDGKEARIAATARGLHAIPWQLS